MRLRVSDVRYRRCGGQCSQEHLGKQGKGWRSRSGGGLGPKCSQRRLDKRHSIALVYRVPSLEAQRRKCVDVDDLPDCRI